MTEKEEITSTEFPEGGDTTYTKGPPASPQGARSNCQGATVVDPYCTLLILQNQAVFVCVCVCVMLIEIHSIGPIGTKFGIKHL